MSARPSTRLQAASWHPLAQRPQPSAHLTSSPMPADTSKPAPTLYKDASTAAAYAIMRMPACYAVIAKVLHELRTCLPDFVPASMLDFGAGPGTATWAAREVRPHGSGYGVWGLKDPRPALLAPGL